jgi:hypothetical protein
VLAAAVLAGCGASHKPQADAGPAHASPAHTVPGAHASPAHTVPARAVPGRSAPQIVYMRRIEGLLFQTIVVRRDGSGEIGKLVGEINGVQFRPFRLARGQLAYLKRLLTQAAHANHAPALGPANVSLSYIVSTKGWTLRASAGHVRPQLAGLVGLLSGLIDRY